MKALILTLIFTASVVYSQTDEIENYLLGPTQDFYGSNYLNGPSAGRGNTGIAGENDLSGALINPAAFTLTKKYSLNLQYTYKTTNEVSYSYVMGPAFRYDLKHIPPALQGGFGMKIMKNLNAGIVYSNSSSLKFLFKEFGSSQTDVETSESVVMHCVNIPIVYDLGQIKMGANPYYCYTNAVYKGVTTINQPDGSGEVTSHYNRFNVQLGLKVVPGNGLSFGLTFTPAYTAEVKTEDDLFPVSSKPVTTSPFRVSAGLQFTGAKQKFRLSADYNFQQTSVLRGYKDKHDFNIGGEYNLNKSTTLRAGFFTIFDIRDFDDKTTSFPGKAGDFTQ